MSGVGKTSAARSIARRYDLWLYSLDARSHEHAARLPPVSRTLDQIWVEMTPDALADWFEQASRERFRLVVDDLLAIGDDAPVIADGPQLLPELVAQLVRSPRQALYLLANPTLQRKLVTERGSLTYGLTRDPEGAEANRLRRDEILAARVCASAEAHNLPVTVVADVNETVALVAQHFEPVLSAWAARGDRGDVAARRRHENDARIRQLRAYASEVPEAVNQTISVACECERSACEEVVCMTLKDANKLRVASHPFLAGH